MSDQQSENIRPLSTRQRLQMTAVVDREVESPPPAEAASPTPTSTSSPRTEQVQELLSRAAWRAGVLGALQVAVFILAARAILLISVCGAICLAYLAIAQAEPLRLGAVGLYTLGVVLPLVWLASRGH